MLRDNPAIVSQRSYKIATFNDIYKTLNIFFLYKKSFYIKKGNLAIKLLKLIRKG